MAVQSLYRRYRPQRFADLRGQDHVVRALRTAVAEGRESQAYLFSGPRGTGKTSTARILAKVLNCENPIDGEPCGVCESCRAVERGISYDVHELDAASNNGVEGVRQVIEKSALGTPGRHKVYILDEVHMLTKPAEAALLKTLEEPPDHVVFVLATTDPQKVSDTIRSRTQHLQFHLLPTDTLRDHARWVAADADLSVTDDALEQVLASGGGSARDTLSALELVAAGGGEAPDTAQLHEVIAAMAANDPGQALAAVAHAINVGRDPRMIAEEIVGLLRDRFLLLMAPEQVRVPSDHVDEFTEQAREVGAPTLVRGIERLGRILLEMRQAPDPRVLLDVAVVELTAAPAGADASALAARVDRLERQLAELRERPSAAATSTDQVVPRDPGTGRATLGGRARRGGTGSTAPAAATAPADAAGPAAIGPRDTGEAIDTGIPLDRADAESDPGAAPAPATTVTPTVSDAPTDDPATASSPDSPAEPSASDRVVAEVTHELWQEVLPTLGGRTRAMYSAAVFAAGSASGLRLTVPNAAHAGKCEQQRAEVEAALAGRVGRPVVLELAVAAGAIDADDPAGPPPTVRDDLPADHDVDMHDLVDVPPENVKTPLDHLAEAFPGSELVEGSS